MSEFRLRRMQRQDWPAVAQLICDSTNAWYVQHARSPIFSCAVEQVQLFCQVYEDLDPGCCIVAEDSAGKRLAGSCFFHPRSTHMSLGIMNVHPDYFGRGIARQLLGFITGMADAHDLPTRLVSSAVNLDSFSLYNRAGFVPRVVYQDMIMTVPSGGLNVTAPPLHSRVRPATLEDVPAMARLEQELCAIEREKDLRYFVENHHGIWTSLVIEGDGGAIDGWLVSVAHPASNMLGPGVMRRQDQAAALIHAQLNQNAGRTPVWLVPAAEHELVQTMYQWGAKNCELHFHQCRGPWTPPRGVSMPTFMPETA